METRKLPFYILLLLSAALNVNAENLVATQYLNHKPIHFLSANQLTVTPTTSYTVRAISIQGWTSQNGTCSGSSSATTTLDNGFGNTVTLIANHAYTSTDASNKALFDISAGATGNCNRDQVYMLLDNNLAQIGASVCLQGSGTCTSSSNCGWNSPRTWNP